MKKYVILLVLTLVALPSINVFNVTQVTEAAPKPIDEDEILCDRDPTAYLVGEEKSGIDANNPCRAKAKIQAIAYECGETIDTYANTQKFFRLNVKKAQKKCEEYCGDLSSKCTGKLQSQTNCGFSIPTNRALETGKNIVKCPKHCRGQAFNYCSLYHSNFFATEPSLFKNSAYNCECKKK